MHPITVTAVYSSSASGVESYRILANSIEFEASTIGSESLPITIGTSIGTAGTVEISSINTNGAPSSVYLDSFYNVAVDTFYANTLFRLRPRPNTPDRVITQVTGGMIVSNNVQITEDSGGNIVWDGVGTMTAPLRLSAPTGTGSSQVQIEVDNESDSDTYLEFGTNGSIQSIESGLVSLRASAMGVSLVRGDSNSASIVTNVLVLGSGVPGSIPFQLGTETTDVVIEYRANTTDLAIMAVAACGDYICLNPYSLTNMYARFLNDVRLYPTGAAPTSYIADRLYFTIVGKANTPFDINGKTLIAREELYIAAESGSLPLGGTNGASRLVSQRIGLYAQNGDIGTSGDPLQLFPYHPMGTPAEVTFGVSIATNGDAYITVPNTTAYTEMAGSVMERMPSAVNVRLIDTFERARTNFADAIFSDVEVTSAAGDIDVATNIPFNGSATFMAQGNIASSLFNGSYGRLLVFSDDAQVSLTSNAGSIGRNRNDRLCIADYHNLQHAQSGCNFAPGSLAEHVFDLTASATSGSIFLDLVGLRATLTGTPRALNAFSVIDVLLRSNTPSLSINSVVRAPVVRIQTRTNLTVAGSLVCQLLVCVGGISANANGMIQSNDVSLLASGGSTDASLYAGASTFVPLSGFGVGSQANPIRLIPHDPMVSTQIDFRAVGSDVLVSSAHALLLQPLVDAAFNVAWTRVRDDLNNFLVSVFARSRAELVAMGGLAVSATTEQSNTILAQQVQLQAATTADIGNFRTINGVRAPERYISLRLPFTYGGTGLPTTIGSTITLEAQGNSIALESHAPLVLPVATGGTATIAANQRFDLRLFDSATVDSGVVVNAGHVVSAQAVSIEAQNGVIASDLLPLTLTNSSGALSLAVRGGGAYLSSNVNVNLAPLQSLSTTAVLIRRVTTSGTISVITPGNFILTLTGSSRSLSNPDDIGIASGLIRIFALGNVGSAANPLLFYNVGPITSSSTEQCADGAGIIPCDTISLSLRGQNGYIDTHALRTVLSSPDSGLSPDSD